MGDGVWRLCIRFFRVWIFHMGGEEGGFVWDYGIFFFFFFFFFWSLFF